MLDTLLFLAPPFFAALIIAGMHAYLGVHVIKRGIIFIDLAFAQLAGLGAIVGVFFKITGASLEYALVMLFIFIGSLIFSFIKPKNERIPQEAIIAIVYGLTLAVSMMVADRISGGSEQIKEILTGNLLWVDWSGVFLLAAVYGVIAVIHVLARRPFGELTEHYAQKSFRRQKANLWDMLFFLTFGVVITFSAPLAGVLLVFSFLIIPASIVSMFFSGWAARILVGWAVAGAAVFFGLYYSYSANAPVGPAIILILGIFLIIAFVLNVSLGKKMTTQEEGS